MRERGVEKIKLQIGVATVSFRVVTTNIQQTLRYSLLKLPITGERGVGVVHALEIRLGARLVLIRVSVRVPLHRLRSKRRFERIPGDEGFGF